MTGLQQQLESHLGKQPTLGANVYVAKGAVVLGDVVLGDCASIWYNAVLRGDINRIVVGARTNIQDTAVLHLADNYPCVVGDRVTIGHGAIVHACTIADEVLIGMRSIVLDGAEIGEHCIVGAGALVPEGLRVPPGSLVLGSPGRIVRALTAEERASIKALAEKYVEAAAYCLQHRINVSTPAL